MKHLTKSQTDEYREKILKRFDYFNWKGVNIQTKTPGVTIRINEKRDAYEVSISMEISFKVIDNDNCTKNKGKYFDFEHEHPENPEHFLNLPDEEIRRLMAIRLTRLIKTCKFWHEQYFKEWQALAGEYKTLTGFSWYSHSHEELYPVEGGE